MDQGSKMASYQITYTSEVYLNNEMARVNIKDHLSCCIRSNIPHDEKQMIAVW